jgi:D-glycerate 3-kinase
MQSALIQDFAELNALPDSFVQDAQRWLIPLADSLRARIMLTNSESGAHDALLIGVSGCQGSGKSTASELLANLLQAEGMRTATLSLDDFYYGRAEREALTTQQHPLFRTRGVPGTHDIALAQATLEALNGRAPQRGAPVPLPRFDKASDEPHPPALWPLVEPAQAGRPYVDAIIFEGWCVGALPQTEEQLAAPCNALEQQEDPAGLWRGYANACLAQTLSAAFHASRYAHLSRSTAIRVRGALAKSAGATAAQSTGAAQGDALMDVAAIHRFVQHFERLTRPLSRHAAGACGRHAPARRAAAHRFFYARLTR